MTPDPAVDAYLASLPPPQRDLLQRLRGRIGRLVPDAVETISYSMPAFKVDGRFFMSFAGWKAHCSIYPLTGDFLEAHAAELEGFDRTKGSLHFTAERPLPDELVDTLIRDLVARVRGTRPRAG